MDNGGYLAAWRGGHNSAARAVDSRRGVNHGSGEYNGHKALDGEGKRKGDGAREANDARRGSRALEGRVGLNCDENHEDRKPKFHGVATSE